MIHRPSIKGDAGPALNSISRGANVLIAIWSKKLAVTITKNRTLENNPTSQTVLRSAE